jgi:hypothetical protein
MDGPTDQQCAKAYIYDGPPRVLSNDVKISRPIIPNDAIG